MHYSPWTVLSEFVIKNFMSQTKRSLREDYHVSSILNNEKLSGPLLVCMFYKFLSVSGL